VFGVGTAPSDTTLDRLLRAVSPSELEAVLDAQVRAMHRAKQLEVDPSIGLSLVAIDGKRYGTHGRASHADMIRWGPDTSPYYQLHALRAVHVGSRVKPVLGERLVRFGAHEGEATTLVPFLEELLLRHGSLVDCVTLDAGFTSWRGLTRVAALGVSFIAGVKGNNAGLLAWAQARLGEADEDPPGGWTKVVREGAGTAREMVRSFARIALVDGPADWAKLGTEVWRVQQEGHQGRTLENRYFLTNLAPDRLTDAQALAAIRAHWGIENDCNWTLDLQLLEDTVTWIHQGNGPEVLAALRMIAYNLLRLLRQRVLRATEKRLVPWRTLLLWVRDALIAGPSAWEPSGIA
jgi:hypothetical protein